ncbi:DUF2461 domain-containing protein [Aliifodinibius sp. S!AR15-10]|uniref:DUF2461 domain-containing protein n=1 Tax=Aliifodinibius sp. S!AR15-10 TaxID=2950437 RepID=UPI002854EEC0|nr:DUF2461 domain-containing protein [Aliifodinibius sp. S!AR15-10]MDR8393895.1 DUF2461 domain-containing protein [Aliifodinibius sp. S!AR15-10]
MITAEYKTFFTELEENNNREWFHLHKNDYEKYVKEPFFQLLQELIPEVEEFEPGIPTNPRDSLFRINRDLRFTKDKTPYNTLMKAGFAMGGKKSILPAYYLGISADTIHVGGGMLNIDTQSLKRIRRLIAEESEEFLAIIDLPSFRDKFKEIKGEKAKRLGKAFQSKVEKVPTIANKQFYVMADLPLVNYLNSNHLSNIIIDHFKEVIPLNNFLKKAFVKYS